MASIKVKFTVPTEPGGEGRIYYQILHDRISRRIQTDFKISATEWNNEFSSVIIKGNETRCRFLEMVCYHIGLDIERLNRIISDLDNRHRGYTVDDVVSGFRQYNETFRLSRYMERIIRTLRNNGKIRTSETYQATLNSFRNFFLSRGIDCLKPNFNDLMVDSLNTNIMEAFQSWHRHRGNTLNTVSFYNRILRAVYNRAVDEGGFNDRRPFRRVYTGVEKTVKRALPLNILKRIRALNLTQLPALDYARDIFFLSFMLRGMSFIDMAFLKKSDLRNGVIVYQRRKTGQTLTIAWTKEMQAILDKYPNNETGYLLPIISKNDVDEIGLYRNIAYRINQDLKRIARLADVCVPLTLYVARHSWASAARSKGIPISVISEGLGHDSETTTRIYLASLDASLVDRANSLIIASI